MADTKITSKIQPEINTVALTVHEVLDSSVIVNVNGWRLRVRTDKLSKSKKQSLNRGQTIIVEYTGSLDKIHEVKLLPLK